MRSIGSEGVTAHRMQRRFVGAELNDAYFTQAVGYLAAADSQLALFGEGKRRIWTVVRPRRGAAHLRCSPASVRARRTTSASGDPLVASLYKEGSHHSEIVA